MMGGKIIIITLVVAIAVVIVDAQSRNDIGKLIDFVLLITERSQKSLIN